jgi:hypothetical protein
MVGQVSEAERATQRPCEAAYIVATDKILMRVFGNHLQLNFTYSMFLIRKMEKNYQGTNTGPVLSTVVGWGEGGVEGKHENVKKSHTDREKKVSTKKESDVGQCGFIKSLSESQVVLWRY